MSPAMLRLECSPPDARPIPGTRCAHIRSHSREDELLARLDAESDWRAVAHSLSAACIDTEYVIARINEKLWASMSERRVFDGSSQSCAADPACRVRLAAAVLAGELRERASGLVAALFALALRDEGEVSQASWEWDIVKLGRPAVPFLTSRVGASRGQTATARLLAMTVLSRMVRRGVRVDEAVAAVRGSLKDPDWLIRNGAVATLGEIAPGDPETVRVLEEVLTSDEDPGVRSQARSVLDALSEESSASHK